MYLLSILDKCLEINEIVRTAQVKLIILSDYFDGKQVEAEYLSEYQACQTEIQAFIFNYEKFLKKTD